MGLTHQHVLSYNPETTGFDLTEVMKANTYDAKTTKNVNFTGLPEEMSAAAKEPETDGKTE